MHWFKHYNTASQGNLLGLLFAQKRYDCVSLWWVLLELMSRFESENERGFCSIPIEIIAREMNMKPTRIRRLMTHISSVSQSDLICETDEKQTRNVSFRLSNWSKLQEMRGGKREAKLEQNTGRSKRLEVRSKNLERRDYSEAPNRTALDSPSSVPRNLKKKEAPLAALADGDVPSPVSAVREAFLKSFQKEFGREYSGWGAKHNALAKRLLQSISVNKAVELATLYPQWNDRWVTERGHAFEIFFKQYERLDAWAHSHDKLITKIAVDHAVKNVDLKRAVEKQESERGFKHTLAERRKQDAQDEIDSKPLPRELPNEASRGFPECDGDPFGSEVFDQRSENDYTDGC